jgi:hypothetical protein
MIRRAFLIAVLAWTSTAWAEVRQPDQGTVSIEWIERAQKTIQGNGSIDDLVREFAAGHPDKEVFPQAASKWVEPYLNLVSVDVDGDGVPEQLLFISGTYKDDVQFFILKRGVDRWEVVYQQRVLAHNDPPDFAVLEGTQGRKTIELIQMYGRGVGSWQYARQFFRVVDGGIAKALEIAKDYNQALVGDDLRGSAESTRVEASGDELRVTYAYHFYGGYSLFEKLGIETDIADNEGTLMKGTIDVVYRWDAAQRKYLLLSSPLSERQLRCFMRIEDEALFRRAFRKELQTLASKGTPIQKKLARYFLRVR